MKNSAADRAYAKRTKQALAQIKLWRIERLSGDQACAERLDLITNELGGIVLDVHLVTNTKFVIVWWIWSDDK